VSGAMISKALEMALKHEVKEQDLLELGDYSLFEYLKQVGRKFDPEITALVEAVERRKLLKRAYVLSPASIPHSVSESLIADYHRPGSVRTRLEETIAAATGLNRSQIIVYCPGNRNFREAGIAVLTKTGVQKLNSPPCPQDITQLERQYEGLWRFYVFAPGSHKTQVNKICHELLGFPSEHF
ncbi:MAG TPA: hypothetical protein VHQ46_01010, partial [Desulfobacteria bacterium]|nr:hypothetical protein [Desulfobacteria bacterium]